MALMHPKKQDVPPEPQGKTRKVEEKLILKELKLEEKIIHNHPKLVSCVTLFSTKFNLHS